MARRQQQAGLLGLHRAPRVAKVSYSAAEGGGHYFVAWGVILVGAVRLERALFKNNNPQQGVDSSRAPDEPPPFTGPQLAGCECTHCHQKIVSYLVGVQCKRCKLPVHRDCRDDHRAEAHAKPEDSVYR